MRDSLRGLSLDHSSYLFFISTTPIITFPMQSSAFMHVIVIYCSAFIPNHALCQVQKSVCSYSIPKIWTSVQSNDWSKKKAFKYVAPFSWNKLQNNLKLKEHGLVKGIQRDLKLLGGKLICFWSLCFVFCLEFYILWLYLYFYPNDLMVVLTLLCCSLSCLLCEIINDWHPFRDLIFDLVKAFLLLPVKYL